MEIENIEECKACLLASISFSTEKELKSDVFIRIIHGKSAKG